MGSSAWKFNEVLVINQPSGENSQFYEYYPREFTVYHLLLAVLSVLLFRDPVPFDPWIRDPKWVKITIRIGDPDSESLETIFRVKILKFLDADVDPDPENFLALDPGSGIEKNLDPG
jgi:hypothetical protein